MSFLDRYTDDKFKVLPDGRTLFLPKGDSGPVYLIPDETTRTKFESLLKVGGVLASAALVAGGKLAFQDDGFHWQWAALLLVVPVWSWHVERTAAEQLQELHHASIFAAPPAPPSEFSLLRLSIFAIAATAGVIAGLATSIWNPASIIGWVGLALSVLAAFALMITLQDIQRTREAGQREHELERTRAWFQDSAKPRRRS